MVYALILMGHKGANTDRLWALGKRLVHQRHGFWGNASRLTSCAM